ncbi:protein S100-A7 [Suncus etruscus]|uniref:protein S100-A7 n=1 Tax=Suncus etruscus TaxID=109475 RepID=UPI00210FDE18|nr:protein S100-A7 [Suncus etruscus]
MSNSEPEKMLLKLLEFFHQNAGEADTLDRSKLEKIMKEHFPTFLSACEKKNPAFLEEFFKNEDKNQDKKINFPEFMSCVSQVAIYLHDQSHNQS